MSKLELRLGHVYRDENGDEVLIVNELPTQFSKNFIGDNMAVYTPAGKNHAGGMPHSSDLVTYVRDDTVTVATIHSRLIASMQMLMPRAPDWKHPMAADVLMREHGGEWLGLIREWIKCKFINGSDITWGSHEPLRTSGAFSAFDYEHLAARIAAQAINEYHEKIKHLLPKEFQ